MEKLVRESEALYEALHIAGCYRGNLYLWLAARSPEFLIKS
jgi:hypothetical protein